MSAALAGVLIFLTGGCSLGPDRSTEAAAVASRLRDLPGVQSVSERYANSVTEGRGLYVGLVTAPNATAGELDTIAGDFLTDTVASGLEGHTLSLRVQRDDDSLAFFIKEPTTLSVADQVADFHALAERVDGAVDHSVTVQDTVEILSTSVDLDIGGDSGSGTDMATAIRQIAEQPTSERQWILYRQRARADLFGTLPTAGEARVLGELADSGDRWSFRHQDPALDLPLSLGVWIDAPEELAPVAREHLTRLREALAAGDLTGPVEYTARVNGQPATVVRLGDCLTGGADLQQQLNREFGTC